jgi:hypothetical protein
LKECKEFVEAVLLGCSRDGGQGLRLKRVSRVRGKGGGNGGGRGSPDGGGGEEEGGQSNEMMKGRERIIIAGNGAG